VPTPFHQAVVAIVQLSVAGGPASNSTYIVMQGDLGDGVYVDLAWAVWTGTSGAATFLLAAGVAGAAGFQQTRAAGTAPASSGSNQCPVPGRIRFVGRAVLTGGSSPAVTATIKYRELGLR
jgi:hypothetical protein